MTRTNAIRLLFLFTAFLAYERPLQAYAEPDWYEQCDSHCEGHIMVTECAFWDVGYGTGAEAGSVCSWFECGTVNCTPDTQLPYPYYESMCSGWAHGAGVGRGCDAAVGECSTRSAYPNVRFAYSSAAGRDRTCNLSIFSPVRGPYVACRLVGQAACDRAG